MHTCHVTFNGQPRSHAPLPGGALAGLLTCCRAVPRSCVKAKASWRCTGLTSWTWYGAAGTFAARDALSSLAAPT